MAAGLLNISLSGLSAAMSGIRSVQQNIANANTEGYHRQQTIFSAATAQFSGSGYMGTGVQVDSVRRIYDQFLNSQMQNYQTQLSGSEAYAAYASQVDSLLGSDATGLGTTLQKFFSSIGAVANDPSSISARQQMLSTGNSLASRFNQLSGNLRDIEAAVDQDVVATMEQINSYSDQIKAMNIQIVRASTSGQEPNDMLDRRDQLLAELGKLVNVSQIQESDGSVTVMLGRGQPLVSGSTVRHLEMVNDPADPSQKVLAIELPGSAATMVLDTNDITGGRLGGLFAFRAEVLDLSVSDLDLMAQSLADAFNVQHGAGYDLNGTAGAAFFAYSSTSPSGSLAVAISQPAQIAAAGAGLVAASGGNTGDAVIGSATLSASAARPLANAPYTLTYSGGNITVTDAAATTVGTYAYNSGSAISFNGVSVTITNGPGGIVDGDSFTVDNSAASAGPGDNSNILALLKLQSGAIVGGASVSNYNITMIGRNANNANMADSNVASFGTLFKQSFDASQAVSGVNLDEEAVNLIQFQQAYQAAAKAIQASSVLFDAILGAIR